MSIKQQVRVQFLKYTNRQKKGQNALFREGYDAKKTKKKKKAKPELKARNIYKGGIPLGISLNMVRSLQMADLGMEFSVDESVVGIGNTEGVCQ